MPRHKHPSYDDEDEEPRGAAQGQDNPRWPGAPEYEFDENGNVTNAATKCRSCDYLSTLSYRCSECGADLVGGSA